MYFLSMFSFPQSETDGVFFLFFILDQNIVAAESNSACTSVVLRAVRTRRASITELIAQGFLSLPYRCALVSALSSLLPINRLTDQ